MRRPASAVETFIAVEGKHKPIHFGYCLTLDAELGEATLRAALDETRRQYLLMAVRMVQDGARRYFVETNGVAPFPVTLYPASERPWTAILQAELLKPFPLGTGPSTRFALRRAGRGTELYAVFHHAFADGNSAVRALNVLLAVLGGAGRAEPAERDHELLASLRGEVVEALSRRPPPTFPPLPPIDPAERERRVAAPYRAPSFTVRTWALSRDETARLVDASRAAGVTVHAALGAAWLTAAAEVLGGADRRTRTIQCPVDLRSYFVEEASDAYGMFIGILTADVDCAPARSLAAVARDIKERLDAQRRDLKDVERWYSYRDTFRDVADPDAFVVGFPEPAPGYDFSLSNLGRLPLRTRYGALQLEAIWGPVFTAVNGERVVGVNTHDGVLRMTDIWDPERCDSAACDRIRELAQARLAAFLAQ